MNVILTTIFCRFCAAMIAVSVQGGPSTHSYPLNSIYRVGRREWVLGCVNLASCRADTSSVCGDPVTFPVPFISRPMNHRREIRAAELSKNGTPHARPRCVNVLLMMIRAPDPTAEPGPLLEVDGQMPRSVQIFHCLPCQHALCKLN